jgi:hypothetical protein
MTDMNPDFQFGQQPQPDRLTQPGTPYTQQGVPQIPPQQPGYAPQSSYAPAGQPPMNNYVIPGKSSKKWAILTVVFITTTLAAIGGGVWAYMNYLDQKNNTDAKISTAVTTAVKNQADKDAASFLEKEKQPNRQFAGPDDYGRLAFDYPKTWSVYVNKDTSNGGTYEAYFNPAAVPPVKADTQYALRVIIQQNDVERVLDSYDNLVKKGDLKATSMKADGTDGTRFEGNFTKDIRGMAVIFKIRDKTVTIRSDAETFRTDFDALISTITFNK